MERVTTAVLFCDDFIARRDFAPYVETSRLTVQGAVAWIPRRHTATGGGAEVSEFGQRASALGGTGSPRIDHPSHQQLPAVECVNEGAPLLSLIFRVCPTGEGTLRVKRGSCDQRRNNRAVHVVDGLTAFESSVRASVSARESLPTRVLLGLLSEFGHLARPSAYHPARFPNAPAEL